MLVQCQKGKLFKNSVTAAICLGCEHKEPHEKLFDCRCNYCQAIQVVAICEEVSS